eukprot:449803_1
MISAILLISEKGEIIISRFYRDDVTLSAANAFRMDVIARKETGTQPPVKMTDGNSFFYTRHRNVYFVAVTRCNVNPALVFEFLYSMISLLQSYFKRDFDADSVKNNMTLIYELMDETMDFGFPQITSVDILHTYINLGSVEMTKPNSLIAGQLTSQITGAIDWRRSGIRYRRDVVYIDVLERINLLVSSTGQILQNDVAGKVIINSQLSGMPDCKFCLNDKLAETERQPRMGRSTSSSRKNVSLDDCTFHRCVRLGKFDADRTITFIPPDGEFELMSYRVTNNINLPFRIISSVQEGKLYVNIDVTIVAQMDEKHCASKVVVKVPVPNTTAQCEIKVASGHAKYEPENRCIVWRIRKFIGRSEFSLSACVELSPSIREKTWSRPPIEVDFQVPMWAASGIQVRFLEVYDRLGYTPHRWVRYNCVAGSYSIRI